MSVFITREMLTRAANEARREDHISLFDRLGRSLARRWRRREAIAELEAMDTALLRDIGITRGEIRHAVDGLTDRGRRAPRRARSARLLRPGATA